MVDLWAMRSRAAIVVTRSPCGRLSTLDGLRHSRSRCDANLAILHCLSALFDPVKLKADPPKDDSSHRHHGEQSPQGKAEPAAFRGGDHGCHYIAVEHPRAE
jgi:hypothetical protein